MSSVLIPFFAAKCTISVAWACVVPMREQQRRFTGRQQSNGNQREHPKLSKMPCSGQQGGLEGGGGGSARAGTPHGTYVGWHPYHAETTAVSEDPTIVSSINKVVFIVQPGASRADMRSTSKGAWDATDRSCWLRRSPSRAEPFRVQATPSCYGVRNTISVTVFSNVFFPVSASPGVPVTRAPIACACAASAVTCLRLPRGCEGRS